jgi:RNA polymerase-binding transcription factor DksA
MTSWPAAPAVTELSNADLAAFEAMLLEQRRFRLDQLAELSTGAGSEVAATATLEIAEELEHAARHALGEIDLALDRLRCGRYGRCVACGQAIGRDRLDVLPSAARCTPCQHRIGNGRPPPSRRAPLRREARSAR